MRNCFNVQFYCRKSKTTKNGTAPIELSLNLNGKRCFLNLPFKAYPEDFARKRQPKEIKDYCDLMRTRINEILTDMLSHDEPLTTERILGYLRSGGYKSYTIEDLFNEFLSILQQRVGTTMCKTVYRKYEIIRDQFFTIIDKTKECDAITQSTIMQFKGKMEKKYDNSTLVGHMSKLKSIITYGIDNGKIKTNPFNNIKIKRQQKPISYLTKEDINVILKYNPLNESMRNVRDCALFQIGTGMSYCDCCDITPEDIKEVNGTYYISKRRRKTGTPFTAVVLPFAMDAYKRGIHFISNQKYNLYLKVIQQSVLPNKRLHSHLFRHTYCTLLLNEGVRMDVVSKAAGHSSITMTESFYAELTKDTIINEITHSLNI